MLSGRSRCTASSIPPKAPTSRHSGRRCFFTTVQLLTVSSSLRNPVTPAGRVVDIMLELWAVVVVAGSAGAVASFFGSVDSS